MVLSYFNFVDADQVKRRCVCDIADNGDITFYTLVAGSSQVSFPSPQPVTIAAPVDVAWTKANLIKIDPSIHFAEKEQLETVVGTSLAEITLIDTRKFCFTSIEIKNGTTALAECQLQVKYHTNGDWYVKTSSGGTEYTTGTGRQSNNVRASIIETSGNLNTLAANSSGWIEIDSSRYHSIKLLARVTAGSTIVSTRSLTKLI